MYHYLNKLQIKVIHEQGTKNVPKQIGTFLFRHTYNFHKL